MVVALLLAACGQGDASADGGAPVETVTPEPPRLMPEWFLEGFPPPPEGAEFHSASQTENPLLLQHHTEERRPLEEKGTVLERYVRLSYGTGTQAELEEVLDYYRTALPESGWEILSEEELDPQENEYLEHPGVRLAFDAHGHEGRLNVLRHPDHISVGIGVLEQHEERAPYSAYPPMIELPAWYATLPEPPGQLRRSRIEVSYQGSLIEGWYSISYEAYSLGGEKGDAAAVADYYRNQLRQTDWRILDVQQETEKNELGHTTHLRERVVLEIAGHGVTGYVTVSQESRDGEWSTARVSVTVDG